MGLALFETSDEAEAMAIVSADPAVTSKVFTCEIKPYRVSLFRKS